MQSSGEAQTGAEEGRTYLSWSLSLLAISFVTFIVCYITYWITWRAQLPPDPPGQFSCYWMPPVGGELAWLTLGLTLYGGLAWPRLGGVFVSGHLLLMAVLSTVYLDHIRHLEFSLLRGARPWTEVQLPVVTGLAAASVVSFGWALWFAWVVRRPRFGLRSLLSATAITAMVLGGLSACERGGRCPLITEVQLPVVTGLAAASVVSFGWALWFAWVARRPRFGLRSLLSVTAITAMVLGGLSACERRERCRLIEEFKEHGIEPGELHWDEPLSDE